MAGALLMRGGAALARKYGPGLLKTVGTAAAGYALEEGGKAVKEWMDKQPLSNEYHRGLDLPAPEGTPVLAPTDAIVVGKQTTDSGGLELFLAGPRAARSDPSDPNRWPRPYAWFARGDEETGRDEIGVDDSGWRFGFAHLSGTNVDVGTVVRRGQQIATTGHSGTPKGGGMYPDHLHSTVFWVQDGLRDIHTFVDPALLIPGLPRSVPTSGIGPGTYVSVCIITKVSTKQQALAQVVLQQLPTGLGVNWAATAQGIK